MRVIVCGGRDYDDWLHVNVTLSNLGEITHLAEGGAPGADYLAAQWCERHPDVLHYTFPADWEKHGRGAGPIRNASMLAEFQPDLVVAFPGGRGTADMVKRAVAAVVKVVMVRAGSTRPRAVVRTKPTGSPHLVTGNAGTSPMRLWWPLRSRGALPARHACRAL